MRTLTFAVAGISAFLLVACGGDGDDSRATPTTVRETSVATTPAGEEAPPAEETAAADGGEVTALTSESLQPDQPIPARFTCDGEDVSPALTWDEPAERTQSVVLLMEDLDSPGRRFTHWVMYDLDVSVQGLPEGVEKTERPGNAPGIQIENDFGEIGYGGPCPPAGSPHRYEFSLIYLDGAIELETGATREDLNAAIADRVIGGASFIATYQR
jgi:Raf kinase inhibitor-like YbhB/YbcL family protein